MKKIALTTFVLMIFCTSIYAGKGSQNEVIAAKNSNQTIVKKENDFSKSVFQYGCSTTFNYGGYTFQFEVSYASSSGCDPCFATETYGGMF